MTKDDLIQLDRDCAEALGLRQRMGGNPEFGQSYFCWEHPETKKRYLEWHPTTNPSQWAELLERFKVNLSPCPFSPYACTCEGWSAHVMGCHEHVTGPTPGVAVVRAVIAMKRSE